MTILPYSCSTMWGITALQQLKTVRRFLSMTVSQYSSDNSVKLGLGGTEPPAVLQSISILPN